jgi:hypothetical protein
LSAKKPNTNPPATDAATPDPTPINVHRLGGCLFGTVRLPGVHGLHATITQRQLLVDIDGDGQPNAKIVICDGRRRLSPVLSGDVGTLPHGKTDTVQAMGWFPGTTFGAFAGALTLAHTAAPKPSRALARRGAVTVDPPDGFVLSRKPYQP